MHEQGIAASIIRQATELAAQHHGTLAGLELQIGELSGVEPTVLQSAIEALLLPSAWVKTDVVPLVAKCRACDEEFKVIRFHFVCPSCHATSVSILRGEDIRLVNISVAMPEESEEMKV